MVQISTKGKLNYEQTKKRKKACFSFFQYIFLYCQWPPRRTTAEVSLNYLATKTCRQLLIITAKIPKNAVR